jgi:hypothetical protein
MQLNPDAHNKSSIQQEEDTFHQQIGTNLKKETSEMLHMRHSFVWS